MRRGNRLGVQYLCTSKVAKRRGENVNKIARGACYIDSIAKKKVFPMLGHAEKFVNEKVKPQPLHNGKMQPVVTNYESIYIFPPFAGKAIFQRYFRS